MRRLLPVLLVLLASSAGAAPLDTVRQNFIDFYTAAGAARSSPRMQAALAGQADNARAAAAPGYLLGNGTWTDIDYTDVPDGAWSPAEHVRRIGVMVRAYRTPGTALYGDPSLRTSIEAALRAVPSFYPAIHVPQGNWWFWTIGVPLDLGPSLVLMRGELDPAVYAACVQTLANHIGSSPTSRGLIGPVPVGENLVWSSYTHLCLALLQDDAAMLAKVRDSMATVCATVGIADDGIQADRSFHQHGAQLYTGGYGGSFANDVARYCLLTRNTDLTLPPAALANFADYLADGIGWSLYGNYFDVSVVGREVARISTTGFNGVAALVQAAQFDSPRSAEIRAAARQMLQSWQWTLPPELAGLATIAEQSAIAPAWPSGHRHYYDSDYTVHRRDGWFASIKMFSTRTKSGEKTNNENLLGSRQSDGRFYLVLDGDEYFGSDAWPAFDWTRLPGITVEQNGNAANDTFGTGTRSFVGGVSDGRNGVSAMDVAPLGATLQAKKSWFFFDDAIVFLTSGINIAATSTNRAETVVTQWPLDNPNEALATDNAHWAFCDRVGYWFPNAMPTISRATRTGSWSILGGSNDTTARSRTLLTMYYDHGTTPLGASVAYAIVPNTTRDAMQRWAAAPPVQILANDTSVSAVRRDNTEGIVFWSAGTFDGISSDLPAIVYTVRDGTKLHLYVTDPTGTQSGSFRVTVPGLYISTDATVTATARGTTVTVPRNGGRTFHATLQLPQLRRRAAR